MRLEPVGQGVTLLAMAFVLYRVVSGVYYPEEPLPEYERTACHVDNFFMYVPHRRPVAAIIASVDAAADAATKQTDDANDNDNVVVVVDADGVAAGDGADVATRHDGGGTAAAAHAGGTLVVYGDDLELIAERRDSDNNEMVQRARGGLREQPARLMQHWLQVQHAAGRVDASEESYFVLDVSFKLLFDVDYRFQLESAGELDTTVVLESALVAVPTRRLRNCTDATHCIHEMERKAPGSMIERGADLRCHVYAAYYVFDEHRFAQDYDRMLVYPEVHAKQQQQRRRRPHGNNNADAFDGGGGDDGRGSYDDGGGGSNGDDVRPIPLRTMLESDTKVYLKTPPRSPPPSYHLMRQIIADEVAAAETTKSKTKVLMWYLLSLCVFCVPCFCLSGLFLVVVGCCEYKIKESLRRVLSPSAAAKKDHQV